MPGRCGSPFYIFSSENPSRPYRKIEEQSCHTADDGTVNPDSLHFIFDTVLCHACHLSAVIRRECFGDTAGNFSWSQPMWRLHCFKRNLSFLSFFQDSPIHFYKVQYFSCQKFFHIFLMALPKVFKEVFPVFQKICKISGHPCIDFLLQFLSSVSRLRKLS